MVSIVRSALLTILSIVAAIVVALLIIIALISRYQERIAFQPERPPFPDVDQSLRVEYSATDGQRLFAFLVNRAGSDRGLLLAFHGNADLAARQVDWAQEVARRTGMAVMVAEYRGYGGLSGKPDYAGSQLDATAAYEFAQHHLGIPSAHIAFFGHSLGTAIAAELAVKKHPFALLLQSPFTSARDMAKVLVGRRPAEFTWNIVSRIHFDTVEKVRILNVPVSAVHGARDRLIPLDMGREVFEAAAVKGQWLVIPDASHNDVAVKGGESYWSWITGSLLLSRDPV